MSDTNLNMLAMTDDELRAYCLGARTLKNDAIDTLAETLISLLDYHDDVAKQHRATENELKRLAYRCMDYLRERNLAEDFSDWERLKFPKG